MLWSSPNGPKLSDWLLQLVLPFSAAALLKHFTAQQLQYNLAY